MKVDYFYVKFFSKQGYSLNKYKQFYKNAKDELHKVIFPIKEQIRSAYISVFTVVTVIALFLALIDGIMSVTLSTIIN